MSERANFRGARGGRGGGNNDHRGRRGGSGGRGGSSGGQNPAEKPKKENILDLTKYMDKEITVKFNGGREGTPVRLFRLLCPWIGLEKRGKVVERWLTKMDSCWDFEGIRSIDEPGAG